jgi:hypothetical protein
MTASAASSATACSASSATFRPATSAAILKRDGSAASRSIVCVPTLPVLPSTVTDRRPSAAPKPDLPSKGSESFIAK